MPSKLIKDYVYTSVMKQQDIPIQFMLFEHNFLNTDLFGLPILSFFSWIALKQKNVSQIIVLKLHKHTNSNYRMKLPGAAFREVRYRNRNKVNHIVIDIVFC